MIESDEQPAVAEAVSDGRPRRRVDKTLLLVSFAIALGLVLVVRGFAISITGDDRSRRPEAIEDTAPVADAVQVPNQTSVFADLKFGYTGVFVIDDVEIPTTDIGDFAGELLAEPGEQVAVPPETIYEAGNATLTFTPSSDAPITGFESGEHRVQLIYWKIDEGRARASSYTWVFAVV